MLIFDKHGDYIGLKNLFNSDVKIFYPQIYLNDLNNQSIVQIVSDLSGEEVTPAQEPLLQLLLSIYQDHEDFVNSYIREHTPEKWQHNLNINTHHFFALYQLLKTLVDMGDVVPYSEYGLSSPKNLNSSASPLTRKLFKCANKYKSMKKSAQYIASKRTIITEPLPRNADLRTLIAINNIAIINFEGFDEKIVQSVTANILNQLTKLRISGWQDGSDTKRIPKFLTVIEEAHNYIPSSSEGEIAPCTPIVKQIATEGRKYGMGLVIISQRPSRLDPTILSACNSFVIMKITNPSDQKYIRDIIESIGEDEVKLLPDLTKGEALLTGQFVRFPILVKVAKGDAVGTYEEDDFLLNIES